MPCADGDTPIFPAPGGAPARFSRERCRILCKRLHSAARHKKAGGPIDPSQTTLDTPGGSATDRQRDGNT